MKLNYLLAFAFILAVNCATICSASYIVNSPNGTIYFAEDRIFDYVTFNITVSENVDSVWYSLDGSGNEICSKSSVLNFEGNNCIFAINFYSLYEYGTNITMSIETYNTDFDLIDLFDIEMYIPNLREIPVEENKTNIFLNSSGTRYGFINNYIKPYSGNYDDFGSIAIKDGIGYTAQKFGVENITAFNTTNGDLIWTTKIGPSDGTPLIDSNGDFLYINVYSSVGKNGVYKLNITNGQILLNNTICSAGTSNSMAQDENLIFDGCRSNTFYAYNKNDLTVNWTYTNVNMTEIPTTPIYDNGYIAFGCLTNGGTGAYNFNVLNSTTGNLIWGNNVGGFWDSQPSTKDGIVYAADNYGSERLYAFNISNGSIIWQYQLANPHKSQIAIYNNEIIVPDFAILNALTGVKKCSNSNLGYNVFQGPSVTNGIAFFGHKVQMYDLWGISTEDCSIVYKAELQKDIFDQASISSGDLFIKDDDYKLYSFDLGNGGDEWSYIGYDNTGKSSCDNCVTEFKNVISMCVGNDSLFNCSVKNNYNYATNVNLVSPQKIANKTYVLQPSETLYITYNSSGFFETDAPTPPTPTPDTPIFNIILLLILNLLSTVFIIIMIINIIGDNVKIVDTVGLVVWTILILLILNGLLGMLLL